jgi:hypothetical protein
VHPTHHSLDDFSQPRILNIRVCSGLFRPSRLIDPLVPYFLTNLRIVGLQPPITMPVINPETLMALQHNAEDVRNVRCRDIANPHGLH